MPSTLLALARLLLPAAALAAQEVTRMPPACYPVIRTPYSLTQPPHNEPST